MGITRRSLLLGAGTGAVAVLLASCTPEPEPKPTPTRTRPEPQTWDPGDVPAPSGWVRSGWSTDPYAFGAMSYLPAGADPQHREALSKPVLDRLFFAGEATDTAHPGSVLGAVDSGRRAGMGVLSAASDTERVAVIGAGAAGVVAARTVAAAGHDVTIFEARERVGGRLLTRQDDDWPIPVQLGAWLVSEDELGALDDRLISLGDEQVSLDTAVTRSADGESDPIDGSRIADAVAEAADLPSDIPVTEALEKNGADPEDPALRAALAWIAATTGADPARASSWYPPAFPSDTLNAVTADLADFAEEALDGLSATLASPVVRVAYDERGVSLRLGTGEAQSYDRVICTAPLGVLQRQGLEFAPALPFAHRGAITALGMGLVETVWLRFDEPFWDAEESVWHISGGDALISTWLNLQPATGEPILVGIVGGPQAEQLAELGDDDAQLAARASLAFFAPDQAED